VHQIDDELHFLNDVRNVLRKLPHVDEDFTVVIAGYPNVGKSSFIRLVSGASPQIASYPFTTKGIIVGHRTIGRERMQFIDTPGVLDRPMEERNAIERQALNAIVHLADLLLFILDASEQCGYPLADQFHLLEELSQTVDVPILVVVNKSDIVPYPGYLNMSTLTGTGLDDVLAFIRTMMEERPVVTTPPPEIQ
jgi:nucleolar GTP-binding protein